MEQGDLAEPGQGGWEGVPRSWEQSPSSTRSGGHTAFQLQRQDRQMTGQSRAKPMGHRAPRKVGGPPGAASPCSAQAMLEGSHSFPWPRSPDVPGALICWKAERGECAIGSTLSPHTVPMQRGCSCHPVPSGHSPDLGRMASMSSVRPMVGMSCMNFCRSWGLTSCSLAAATHPKWGLVSARNPGSQPHTGGPATAGQHLDPRGGLR